MKLLLTTEIILFTSCPTQKQITKVMDLNYQNIQTEGISENYNNFSFKRLNKFQEAKITNPVKIRKEKVVFQKIQPSSDELLPFILKDKKNSEYLFIKVKTPQGKFAEKLLIYDPFESNIDVSKIDKKTLLTEESLPKINKRNLEENISANSFLIFNENYLINPVALFYEKEPDKTNFYLIPEENSKIKRLIPSGNLLIESEKGVYRGFNLNSPSPDTQERAYKIL